MARVKRALNAKKDIKKFLNKLKATMVQNHYFSKLQTKQ